MMGWLIPPIITSIVASILIVKIWDTLFGGVTNSFLGLARTGLFVGTWVTIITATGMRGVNGMTRRLSGSALLRRLKAFAGSEGQV